MCTPDGGTAAQNTDNTPRQIAFTIARCVIRIITIISYGSTEICIFVVEVAYMYCYIGGCYLVFTLSLQCQPVQTAVLIVSSFVASGTLIPVLREDQSVCAVIFILHVLSSRELLPDATVKTVVFILKGILVKVGNALVHGLQNKAKAMTERIIFPVYIVRYKQGIVWFIESGDSHIQLQRMKNIRCDRLLQVISTKTSILLFHL